MAIIKKFFASFTVSLLPEEQEDDMERAISCEQEGFDGLLVREIPGDEPAHRKFLAWLHMTERQTDLPIYCIGSCASMDDVKDYFYNGARGLVFSLCDEKAVSLMEEAAVRFGKDRFLKMDENGALLSLDSTTKYIEVAASEGTITAFLSSASLQGVILDCQEKIPSAFGFKTACERQGINVNSFHSSMSFSSFKTDRNGLIPVVVQDYKTDEVLMVAYMNKESYQLTCETGKMTYFSRSRQKLWVKGETSGHFQYVKELRIDCDEDTILAKVKQIGAACHTGNRSCFYRTLVSREYSKVNPLKSLQHLYNVVEDRKNNPREGSYTNQLFGKGLDAILKKCGQEAGEMLVAGKNPDPEETSCEIADLLYHMTVLMVEKGITWDDITQELAERE